MIQYKGKVDDQEMYHTLNMGIGLVLMVQKSRAAAVLEKLSALKLKAWIIGQALKGTKKVKLV